MGVGRWAGAGKQAQRTFSPARAQAQGHRAVWGSASIACPATAPCTATSRQPGPPLQSSALLTTPTGLPTMSSPSGCVAAAAGALFRTLSTCEAALALSVDGMAVGIWQQQQLPPTATGPLAAVAAVAVRAAAAAAAGLRRNLPCSGPPPRHSASFPHRASRQVRDLKEIFDFCNDKAQAPAAHAVVAAPNQWPEGQVRGWGGCGGGVLRRVARPQRGAALLWSERTAAAFTLVVHCAPLSRRRFPQCSASSPQCSPDSFEVPRAPLPAPSRCRRTSVPRWRLTLVRCPACPSSCWRRSARRWGCRWTPCTTCSRWGGARAAAARQHARARLSRAGVACRVCVCSWSPVGSTTGGGGLEACTHEVGDCR